MFLVQPVVVLATFFASIPMPNISVPLKQWATQQSVFNRPIAHPPAGLPVPNPTRSFWINSAPDSNPLASEGSEGPLTKDADVCIIGSGITGAIFRSHTWNHRD